MDTGFEEYQERRPPGLFVRGFEIAGQILGLVLGGGFDFVRRKMELGEHRTIGIFFLRIFLAFTWPFLDKKIVSQPFSIQFRLRLQKLGPTYIKLGQILSLREDLLPKEITDELKNLLDRLPAVSYERFKQLIVESLDMPLNLMFRWIDPIPLGSASLAQTHRARLVTNEKVVIKALKPGVRTIIERDTRLLRFFGSFLQLFLARYQPARIINEFSAYTLREVDLRMEADNAETFAAYFKDEPEVRFPLIYRKYSSRDVLCMEYFNGIKPDQNALKKLTLEQRHQAIDLGVGAIVRMIYRDGFFHADLHPANLMIFKKPGSQEVTIGFIDLGMVGRFTRDMRKRMFYYFYSLVTGDPESAARYLTSLTIPGKGADIEGFRRAASDLYTRWLVSPNFKDFSLAQVILQSVLLAGHYQIQYPGEIILMVKALVTIEGVSHVFDPSIDIPTAARSHVRSILFQEFNPVSLVRDSALVVPEMVDVLRKSPLILSEGIKVLEANLKKPPSGPLNGVRGTLLAGFCLLAGALILANNGPWYAWAGLFLLALLLAIRS
ncbi:MAG: ubiquinone biosynthesis protein UbiB [Anaerolineales bacterium]|nr:AarF/ABC1/UbiB kinase family protein [Anaerolineae bacterium]PWB51144.1 MAG: ubiquinone biosynthesis protein UbiB [Anaerolineales bacterium]